MKKGFVQILFLMVLILGCKPKLPPLEVVNTKTELTGNNWVKVQSARFDGEIHTLKKFGQSLFIGGDFTVVGGQTSKYSCEYTSAGFYMHDNSLLSGNGFQSFYVDKSNTLFGGGKFTSSSGINRLASWDGTNWQGIFNPGGSIYSVTEGYLGGFNGANNLVAGGSLPVTNEIVEFDGYNAFNYGGVGGISNFNGIVYDLENKGSLYACGNISINFTNGIARYDASQDIWVHVKSGLADIGHDMEVFNNELYIVGEFTYASNVSGTKYLAKYDGTNFLSVGGGLNSNVTGKATCLFGSGNYLYIGGLFTQAGNKTVSNFAYWDGFKLKTLGIGLQDEVTAISTFNGQIYVATYSIVNGAYLWRWE